MHVYVRVFNKNCVVCNNDQTVLIPYIIII